VKKYLGEKNTMEKDQNHQQSLSIDEQLYQEGNVKPYSFTCPDHDSNSVMYVDRDRSDSALNNIPSENRLGPNTLHTAPATTQQWNDRGEGDFSYISIKAKVATLYVKLHVPGEKIDTKNFYYFQHPDYGPCQVRFTNNTFASQPRAFTEDGSGDIKYDPADLADDLVNDLLVPEQWYADPYDAIRVPGACGIVAECSAFGPALAETTSPCFQIWTTPEKGGDICCKTSETDENSDNPMCDADKCYHSYECQDDGCKQLDFVPGGADFTSGSAHDLWANSHDECNSGDGCASKLNILWIKHKISTCLEGAPWGRDVDVAGWGILEGVTREYYLDELSLFGEGTEWTDTQKQETQDTGTKLSPVFSSSEDGDCFEYEMYYGNDFAKTAWMDPANMMWGIRIAFSAKNDINPNNSLDNPLHTLQDIEANPDLWPSNCCACNHCSDTTQMLQDEEQSNCCEGCYDPCTQSMRETGETKDDGSGNCHDSPDDPCDCPKTSVGFASAGCDPHICTFFGETYEM